YRAGLFEFEPLSPHEEQSDDVAKTEPRRIGVFLEALETVEEEIIVDGRPAQFINGRNAAGPETEGAVGRSLPGFVAEVAAEKLAAFFEKNAVKALSFS